MSFWRYFNYYNHDTIVIISMLDLWYKKWHCVLKLSNKTNNVVTPYLTLKSHKKKISNRKTWNRKKQEEFWQIGFVANLKYVLTTKSWWNCHYHLKRRFDFLKEFVKFVNGLSTDRDTVWIGYMMRISIKQSTTKNANGQSCHLTINWDGHSLSTYINIEYW